TNPPSLHDALPISEQPHPPRMGLAGDQDDRAVLLMSKSRAEHSDFIRGIDDRGLQHANGLRGNSLVDQDACAVNLFAFVSESHSLQSLPRLGRVREPYLRGVALAI